MIQHNLHNRHLLLLIQHPLLSIKIKEIMNNEYEENQKRLVEVLKTTQSYVDSDPFVTFYERRDAFESFLYGPDGLPNCGCGNPDDTLQAFVEAMNYCALKDNDERKAYLQEKFGAEYVSDDRLVQLVFYVLDNKSYIEHNYTIGGSYLTSAGKVLLAIFKMYFNEPTVDQIADEMFNIDFDAVLAAD